MKKRVASLFLLILLALLAWRLAAVLLEKKASGKGGRDKAPVAVRVEAPERRTLRDTRVLTGSLASRSQFVIAPKIAGRLEQVPVDIGDPVRNGDLVARLDDQEHLQQVEEARAELEVARANVLDADSALEVAARDHGRAKELLSQKVASEAETEQARAKFLAAQARQAVAQAQVRQAEAALKAADIRLSYTRIAATWENGGEVRFIGERFADEGAMLKASDPIVSVLDLETLTAEISVIERDYALIRTGMTAVVTTDARPGMAFPGAVARKAPLLKVESRQALVEIEVPNPGLPLAPGMFIRAEIELAVRPDVQTVPAGALVRREDRAGVFVAAGDKARFVPVTPGLASGPYLEIAEPVLDGPVVTLGQHLLEDGSAILPPGDGPGRDGRRP